MTDAEIAALRNEMDQQRQEIRDYLENEGVDVGPWDETRATGPNTDLSRIHLPSSPIATTSSQAFTRATKRRRNCSKGELVNEQSVTTDLGTRLLFELTETGREYADTRLEIDTEHRGRGGIVYRYWQHRIKELFEKAGWSAKRELFDADVYVNVGETELVIEIAMSDAEREIDHVQQHLKKGFDAI